MADEFIYKPGRGELPVKPTQKLLEMFFVVDTSGSMVGERINAVNDAFTQMIPALRQIQMEHMSEFELRIAILTFNQNAEWIVPPTPIMEYDHEEIICSKWVANYSEAFKKLNEKLTRTEYMAHTGKMAAPYIMLMTDGEPTPGDNYQPELDALLENGWFIHSYRYAVLIGEDVINSSSARFAVSRFVKNEKEGIINAPDAADIASSILAIMFHAFDFISIPPHVPHRGKQNENDPSKENDRPGEDPEDPFKWPFGDENETDPVFI